MRTLTRSANHGRLWLGVAAVGFLVPGRTRRAAVRGAGALAATSFLVNVVLKQMARRPRPLIERTPVVRRLRRTPRTTSFPSGHAASAAAFATGVGLEAPAAGAALAPLAAAVGYSRVHVGVHHLSDVIAGAAVGAGVALATQRWWPPRPDEVARVGGYVRAPALPGGRGLVVVVNPEAGSDQDDARAVRDRLPEAELVELAPGVDLDRELDRRAAAVRAFGVAGGDGTVAAVAAAALRHGLPLAVFPSGTFNHFSRAVGLTTFDATVQALEAGDAAAVDLATANGVPFLNTAVIGAYPEMVRRREALEPRVGTWLATAIAAGQVLRRQPRLRLTIDGRPTQVWTLFVGNGSYTPRGALPAWRSRLDDGRLDVHYLRADIPFSRTLAVLSTLAGVAERHGAHRARLATELTVESRSGPVQVACDGEPGERASGFRFDKLPGSLVAYRPSGAPRG
jgi:undecaprenyl-diphosphatase